MQNFDLLTEVGRIKKPVILKRGLSGTLEEWLGSAEYILLGGNPNVVLCERGIRTFETATRNTADLAIIPLVRETTHLPVIFDPSHATGKRKLVSPMALASIMAGAQGVMVEIHPEPERALSDGPQSLHFKEFEKLQAQIRSLEMFARRKLSIG
jgi:3-deoxy-7-phosphoheptulonate synthase